MRPQYYYLVAGLPAMVLDSGRPAPSYKAVTESILEQLDSADAALLRKMRQETDHANLLARLDGARGAFRDQGNFTDEETVLALKNPAALPSPFPDWFAARAAGRPLFPGLLWEDQLAWLYYDEMIACGNGFLRQWYAFERDRKNLLAALNARSAGRPVTEAVIGDSEMAGLIRKSRAADFGVTPVSHWAGRLLALNAEEPTAFELGVERIRWDMLDQLSANAFFSADVIFAFCVRIASVNRWQALNPEAGRDLFQRAIRALENPQPAAA
ncbi:MAG: DUF2764 family protein [Fibrobacterota bacterium]